MLTYPHWIFDGSPIDDPPIFKTKTGEMIGGGERAVRFLRSLKHPKSRAAKRAFVLDAWLERIVRRIYGARHKDGTPIIKTVLLLLPRGNRKTSLAAALALLHTIGPERVPGGEVISAASDQKQARIGFDEAANIIRCDTRIRNRIRVVDHRNRIIYPAEGTFYEAISSDAGTQHGRTPVFVLADELHAWKRRDLWDVLRSGLPKTKGSLVVIATTAGRGQDNVAFEIYDYGRKVARGDIEDPAFLPILFEAPADCDWRDEEIWKLVNPGLACGYPDIDGLRQLAREAENRPGDRESFRQLHLNIWLDHSHSPFVEMAVYDRGNTPIDLDALRGRPCWLAVDLSSTTDLTAIVAAWKDDDGGYIVKPWFFCPGDNLRARADIDGVPYPFWKEQEFITPTPGNVVDYDYVEETIRDLCAKFDVQEIAFDPHKAIQTMTRLLADGLPVVEMRQGWITMAPAVMELERAIIAGKFQHGGHPVLRWNFSNIAVDINKAENKTFHKGKSTDRIDGAQAAAMAVGRAFAGETRISTYNDPAHSGLFIV